MYEKWVGKMTFSANRTQLISTKTKILFIFHVVSSSVSSILGDLTFTILAPSK